MITSILDDVKKALGITADNPAFDPDIIMHANSAFSTLHQLGLGPVDGFMIEDNTAVWSAFLSDNPTLNSVKSYVYMSVRYTFDPPQQSAHLTALKQSMTELEWRLNVVSEIIANPEEVP
jgi:hypothetical protein